MFKNHTDGVPGAWFSGALGSAGLIIGLDDLKVSFPTKTIL